MEHTTDGFCLIYARVSTTSKEQENSLEVQSGEEIDIFDAFKNKYNYTTYKVYADAKSGTTENRKGFQDMLKFIGIQRREHIDKEIMLNGNEKIKKSYHYYVNEEQINRVRDVLHINYILCKNTSRWTRMGDYKLIDVLKQNGIYIYFLDEGFDTSDAGCDTILRIFQQLDRSKSQDTSLKVKSGMKASMERKRVRTNQRIYGYSFYYENEHAPVELKAIPEEAEVVRLIYKLYTVDEIGTRQIKNYLDSHHLTNRDGKPFCISSIKRILFNEKYAGYTNMTPKWDSGSVFNNHPPKRIFDYVIENCENIEPIIDYNTFCTAIEIAKKRSIVTQNIKRRGKNTGRSKFYHKIKCGFCHSWYAQNSDKSASGETVKKYNCINKKMNGISKCDNFNISEKEIIRRFEEFLPQYEETIIKRKKRLLEITQNSLLVLLENYEYFTTILEDVINKIKECSDAIKENAKLLSDEDLSDIAKKEIKNEINSLAEKKEKLTDKKNDTIKEIEAQKFEIDNLIIAIRKLQRLEKEKPKTVEDLVKLSVYMEVYEDDYIWLIDETEIYNMIDESTLETAFNYSLDDRYDVPHAYVLEKLKPALENYGLENIEELVE